MKDIPIRTAEQLGYRIRLRRKEKGLSQTALAEKLGVERKWVIRFEAGNPKAELGLVLRALDSLGLQAVLTDRDQGSAAGQRPGTTSTLDEVFRRLERPGRK